MDHLKNAWQIATSNVDWGVQKAFVDVLTLAKDNQVTLVYGADYKDKGACLVNQAGPILMTGGGHGVPSRHYGEVVALFDRINREFAGNGVNETPGYVSPLAAEILLQWFAPLKPEPKHKKHSKVFYTPDQGIKEYIEATDEEIYEDLMKSFSEEAIEEASFHKAMQVENAKDPITAQIREDND